MKTLYRVRLQKGHGARPEDNINGFLGNAFGCGEVQLYSRGQALKKAGLFGGKAEKVPPAEMPKEEGAAEIHIELSRSKITVRHTSKMGKILFERQAVKGDWDDLWEAIRQE